MTGLGGEQKKIGFFNRYEMRLYTVAALPQIWMSFPVIPGIATVLKLGRRNLKKS